MQQQTVTFSQAERFHPADAPKDDLKCSLACSRIQWMPWRALWLPVFLFWAPLSGRTARLYSYAGAVSDINTLFPLTDTLDQYFQCPPNTFCPTHWTVLLPIPLGNDELYIRAVGGAAKLIYEKLGFNYTTEQYKPYIWLNNNSAPGTLVNTGPAGNVTSSRWTEWVIDTPVLVSGTIWAGLQHVGGQGLIYPVFPTSAVIGTDFTETFPLGNNPALQSIGDPPLALYVDVLTKTPTMTMTMTPTSTVIPTFTPTPTMTQTNTQTVTETSTVIPTATATPTATRTGTRSVSLTSTPTRRYIYDRPLSIQDTDALREGWFGALPTLASPFTAAQRLAVSNAITARGGEQFAYSDGTVTYVSVQEGRNWNVAWTQSSTLTLSSVGANTTQLVTVCYDPSRFSSSLAPAGYGTPLLLCYVDRIATGGAAANGQALTFSFTEAASSASVSAAAYAAVTDVLALVGCGQSSNIVVCTVPHTSMVVALAGPFSPSPVPTSSPKPSASNDNLALLGLVVLIPVAAILGCVVYYWVRRHQRLSVLEYHGPGLQFVPQGGLSAPPTPMPGFASPPPDLPGFAPWGWGPGSVSGAPSVAPSVASSGYASPAPDLFPGTLTFSFPPTHPNYSYSYHLPPFV